MDLSNCKILRLNTANVFFIEVVVFKKLLLVLTLYQSLDLSLIVLYNLCFKIDHYPNFRRKIFTGFEKLLNKIEPKKEKKCPYNKS